MDLESTPTFETPLIRRSTALRSRMEAVPALIGSANAHSQKVGVGSSEISGFFGYQLGTDEGFSPDLTSA